MKKRCISRRALFDSGADELVKEASLCGLKGTLGRNLEWFVATNGIKMSKHVVEVPNPAQKIPGTDLMLHQVPSATDNLIWLISAPDGQTFAVDGPAIREVDIYCEEHRLNLMGILNTHTHGDHIGINHALMRAGRLDAMTVVGARKTADAIPGLTMPVEDGDRIEVLGTPVDVMLTEGHINGHISYLVGGALFCGDTLFGGGCGYLFDGPPARCTKASNAWQPLSLIHWSAVRMSIPRIICGLRGGLVPILRH